jgi:hypothetical protein
VSLQIVRDDQIIRVEARSYTWEWSATSDEFRLQDRQGRTMVSGRLQPVLTTQEPGGNEPQVVNNTVESYEVAETTVTIRYCVGSTADHLTVSWRFTPDDLWLDPVIYSATRAVDVVSLMYFAEARDGRAHPALKTTHVVAPAISFSTHLGPVIPMINQLNLTTSIGTGSTGDGVLQLWGLPTHYFCTFNRDAPLNAQSSLTRHQADSLCFGLADLPGGDYWLEMRGRLASPVVNYYSQIWGHVRGPGELTLGATQYITVGSTYYEAIRAYYRGLLAAGIIASKDPGDSPRKKRVGLAAEFNTWGAQVARQALADRLDQSALTAIYEEYRASGMRAEMVVIDDKWEGRYGNLRHDEDRLPDFLTFLDRVRVDGHFVGLWAALLRCQDPADIGLEHEHMLQQPDGSPYVAGNHDARYYLFDVTQPEVQRTLRRIAKQFISTYKPDLVKFDFGYELPPLHKAAPKDKAWTGERQLQKGLEVLIGAMKEENPDLVIMYYGLSPLLLQHYDIHSIDDLCLSAGDYELEANRHFFFSSLCGELGMPTYGSSGYDWETTRDIYFDTAAVGTVGSLNAFAGDERDQTASPAQLSKYNGVAAVRRPAWTFTIEPLDANYIAPGRGATASSWARHEAGQPVLVALRSHRLDGRPGVRAYRDLVRTTASVVVASLTDAGLAQADRLGLVPFGDGEVVVQRESRAGGRLLVTEHCFGGGARSYEAAFSDGAVRLTLQEHTDDGGCVEWVEVEVR